AIHMSVIAAGKLHDQLAPGETARQANPAHGRLGPRANHAHHLDTRNQLNDQLGQLSFQLGRSAEGASFREGFTDRLKDAWMVVAQDERAPRADKIEITIAVDIKEIRSFASGDEKRLASDSAEGPGRTVHAAGNHFARALKGESASRTLGIGA